MRVAIVGVGLIGGSLGMAARRAPLVERVVGVARRAETIAHALELGAIDEGTTELAGVRGCDLVILCPPVRTIVPLLERLAGELSPGAVVTDAGSTKGEIVAALHGRLPAGTVFIGGHPMAGSEQSGVAAADPYLFQNAVYALTPEEAWLGRPLAEAEAALRAGGESGRPELDRLWRFAAAIGAAPFLIDAHAHDAIVAAVSHLPHVVAAALVEAVAGLAEQEPRTLRLAAGGFRDTTRIASGPGDVWRDICLMNRSALLACLDAFSAALGGFRAQIAAADGDGLERAFDQAAAQRARLPARGKGIIHPLHELVIQLADRPGAIADVTARIAAAGINLADIEILRVREGEGGTLRLGFDAAREHERARALLAEAGYLIRR